MRVSRGSGSKSVHVIGRSRGSKPKEVRSQTTAAIPNKIIDSRDFVLPNNEYRFQHAPLENGHLLHNRTGMKEIMVDPQGHRLHCTERYCHHINCWRPFRLSGCIRGGERRHGSLARRGCLIHRAAACRARTYLRENRDC
jgi:hypothetical protein